MENLPSSLFLLQQPMNVSNHIQSNDYVVTLISFFFSINMKLHIIQKIQ